MRKTHYLIWEEIDYNGTPVYRQPTSKYDVQRRYKIEYRYERGVWGTAFKVTEAYLNAAEAAAMLYKENNQSEYRTKAQTLARENNWYHSFVTNDAESYALKTTGGLTYVVMEWKK